MKLLTALFPVFCLAAVLRGAPLDRRQLPADVKWFIHLDVDAGRASMTGQALLAVWRAQPGSGQVVEAIKAKFNVEPTRDIHGVTVYGTGFAPETCALVVRGKIDHDKLLAGLRQRKEFQAGAYLNHDLYSWTEQTPNDAAPRKFASAFFDADTLIVGGASAVVTDALDVLDGKKPPLAGSVSPLAQESPQGTVVEGGAIGLADARNLPIQSPVLRQCEYGLVSAGEYNGQVFCKGLAATHSPEMAENVRTLIAGARAFSQLNHDDSEAAHLFAPLEVGGKDCEVRVSWQMPAVQFAELVIGMIKRESTPQSFKEPQAKP